MANIHEVWFFQMTIHLKIGFSVVDDSANTPTPHDMTLSLERFAAARVEKAEQPQPVEN